ncbi:MAG: transglutaminase-like domain-containing protein [archaeon]
MKKAVMIAIALILVQIAAAQVENYNQYSELEIKVNVQTTIVVEEKGTRTSVEYLQADLELFPRTTPEQEILSQDVKMTPTGSVKEGDRDIKMEWEDVEENTIEFNVESTVKTENRVRKIERKIDFPIQDLQQDLIEYTRPTQYIDINDDIRTRAAKIVEGETDLYVAEYKLGEWVRQNIEYDLNTLTASVVQKSSWVLTNKEGVCDEITNLFISMSRSLGVPARFVSGVVYSNVGYTFENHGWAEVYIPEYGWVPFDVTFGQYGWIDPSHVKMDESTDSGEPAITYNWQMRNGELRARPLKIETEIIRTEGTVASLAKLEIRPIEQDVGFGSYMIMEVTAENTQSYYLPLSFTITKAPQTVQDEPTIHTLLKPKETRKFYWTLKIPDNLDASYIYSTELQVESNFAEKATSKIRYGQGFRKYTKEWAEETYDRLIGRESKILFTNIELNCTTDKKDYLSTDTAKVICLVRNLGNSNLDRIDVCAEDKCKQTALTISQQKEISFEIELRNGDIKITAEQGNYLKEQTIKINVKKIPEIKILSYEPQIIDYSKQDALTLKLFTKEKAKDITIEIKNLGDVTIPELEGTYTVNVPIKGRNFRKGVIEMTIKYKSETGEEFESKEKIQMTIRGLPWYAKLLNWLGF